MPKDVRRTSFDNSKGLLPFSSYNLQGRGITPFIKQHRIDVSRLFRKQPQGTVSLSTAISVPRDQAVKLVGLRPGVTVTINGIKTQPNTSFMLQQGAHHLVVTLNQEAMQQPFRSQPIDQQALIVSGEASAQQTPEWQYFGPFPEAVHLNEAQRQELTKNKQLYFDNITFQPTTFLCGKTNSLMGTVGYLPSLWQIRVFYQQQPGHETGFKPSTLYATANYEAPTDGHVLIHSSADYFMQWWINGTEYLNTNQGGNRSSPHHIAAHTLLAPVKQGNNHIMVRLQCGSKGIGLGSKWSFIPQQANKQTATSLQALAIQLAERFPYEKGVQPLRPSQFITPQFFFIDDPANAKQQWLSRIRSVQDQLEALAQGQSTEASRASRLLSLIERP